MVHPDQNTNKSLPPSYDVASSTSSGERHSRARLIRDTYHSAGHVLSAFSITVLTNSHMITRRCRSSDRFVWLPRRRQGSSAPNRAEAANRSNCRRFPYTDRTSNLLGNLLQHWRFRILLPKPSYGREHHFALTSGSPRNGLPNSRACSNHQIRVVGYRRCSLLVPAWSRCYVLRQESQVHPVRQSIVRGWLLLN